MIIVEIPTVVKITRVRKSKTESLDNFYGFLKEINGDLTHIPQVGLPLCIGVSPENVPPDFFTPIVTKVKFRKKADGWDVEAGEVKYIVKSNRVYQ